MGEKRTCARNTLLAALLAGCAVAPSPVNTLAPARDSIPEQEIEREMQSLHAHALYGVAFSLFGGAAGLFLGGKIGYSIGYNHDIQRGCEDCGLEGLLLGGAVGGLTGIVGGAVLGTKVGGQVDRVEAIRRIRARRAGQSTGTPR